MQVIKYVFQPHGDDRGQLVSLEEFKDIPFRIKRVYYMYDTGQGVTRGYHAHKSLQQILVCIHGSCKILLDNGTEKKVVPLEKPYEGLYVSNNMWREMFDFSPGAVFMVLIGTGSGGSKKRTFQFEIPERNKPIVPPSTTAAALGDAPVEILMPPSWSETPFLS